MFAARLLASLLAVLLLAPVAAALPAARLDGAPGEGLVMFNVGFHGAPEVRPGDLLHGARVVAVDEALQAASLRALDAPRFERLAAADPALRYVSRDRMDALRVDALPDDPLVAQQWALRPNPGIDAPGAWARGTGAASVVVAVLDTGIDRSHEDFSNLLRGRDFVNSDDDPEDRCGHGTHVAGTVGAATGNGRGIAGVAQASLLPVKVIDKTSYGCTGSFWTLARAIVWATDEGARVISMSLGCRGCSDPATVDAISYAARRGVLLVAAAGNSGPCFDCVSFPANHPSVMAVGATDREGRAASFSSRGVEVEIAAPGVEILSAYPGDRYRQLSGTSMAAPHVAGVAALVLSQGPTLQGPELRDRLKSTARDLGMKADQQGSGLVDACAAVLACAAQPGPAPAPEPAPAPTPEPEPPQVQPEPPQTEPQPDPAPALHVHTIRLKRTGDAWTGDVRISVHVRDASERPVAGATVSVSSSASRAGTFESTGVTDADGIATFVWRSAGTGIYTTCVTALAKDGYDWDRASLHARSRTCARSFA